MDTLSTHPPVALPDDLISIGEAAAALGVGRRTLHDNIHAGVLPAYRIGRKLLKVSRADLAALVQPVTAEDPDAAFVREVTTAAGKLSAEARAEIRRLLPTPSTEAVAR